MTFKEFTAAVLDGAQKWFSATLIILSCRPSIALNTKHAIAMYDFGSSLNIYVANNVL